MRFGLFLVAGIFMGWILFHSSQVNNEKQTLLTETGKGTVWTCAMHPQIRMPKPGNCPICGMELIPVVQNNSFPVDSDAVHLSKEAAELANVSTSVVTRQKAVKEVRMYGKVQADERLLQDQVAQVPGRIEQLAVSVTGESVVKGQELAEIYSPELIAAEHELLETIKTKQSQPELYEASKEKLRHWKLTDNQIASIESAGIVQNNFKVESNTTGTVILRQVNPGDLVSRGSVLFKIADLSKVWVMFDAYESDLRFLRNGEKVAFTLQALPGIDYTGSIAFIDPIIDPVTRVAKVRVETDNRSGNLKPEMFASGIVYSNLDEGRNLLVIPASAVLWTGKRSIVYVKQPVDDAPVFKLREVELGPVLGERYVIIRGLSEGEEIVSNGTFSIDAASQLEGKPSMMNPLGRKAAVMSGMDMPGEAIPKK